MKPTFRLAWREIIRHKLRTLISIMIIAIPVGIFSLGAVETWAEMRPLSDPAIQAEVSSPSDTPVVQDPQGIDLQWGTDSGDGSTDQNTQFTDPSQKLSTDSLQKIVSGNTAVSVYESQAFVLLDSSAHSFWIKQLDAEAAPGYLGLVEGRAPRTGEIALDGNTAHSMGMHIGDEFDITVHGLTAHVRVCAITSKSQESFLGKDTVDLSISANEQDLTVTESWLVVGAEPVTWDHVKEINKQGSSVKSAWVTAHPPAQADRYSIDLGFINSTLSALAMVFFLIIAVLLVLIVLVLMITPVFTMSTNRMRRSLGQIVMNGGEARHLRTLVLCHGAIVGIFGGLLGTFGGLAVLARINGTYILRIPWAIPIALGVAISGVLLGLCAAMVPAVQASRMTPVEAAKVRTSVTAPKATYAPQRARTTWIFLAMFAGSTVVIFMITLLEARGTSSILSAFIFPSCVLVEVIGAIGLVPSLVWLISSKLRFGPITKIAMRDLLRSSHRTVPAVGAIVGVLIGTTMILSFFTTTSQSDAEWTYRNSEQMGVGTLTISSRTYEKQLSTATAHAIEHATTEYVDRFGHAHAFDSYEASQTSDSSLEVWAPSTLSPNLITDYTLCYAITHGTVTSRTGERTAPMKEVPCTHGTPTTPDLDPAATTWTALPMKIIDNVDGAIAYYGLQGADAQQLREAWRSDGVIVNGSTFTSTTTNQEIPFLTSTTYYLDNGSTRSEATSIQKVPASTITWFNPDGQNLPEGILITRATAEKWGLTPTLCERTLIFDQPLQPIDSFAVSKIAHGYDSTLAIWANQRSFWQAYSPHITVALALIGLFAFTIFVMAIAGVDMRADYATLFAVGASPRSLNSMSMVEGLAMGGVGVLVGLPAGLIPVIALLIAAPANDFHFPWIWLLAVAVLVPCVTTVAAAITRPRKLTLTQRFE